MQLISIQTNNSEPALFPGLSRRFEETSETAVRDVFHAFYCGLRDMTGPPDAETDDTREAEADHGVTEVEAQLITVPDPVGVAAPSAESSDANAVRHRRWGDGEHSNETTINLAPEQGESFRTTSRSWSEAQQPQAPGDMFGTTSNVPTAARNSPDFLGKAAPETAGGHQAIARAEQRQPETGVTSKTGQIAGAYELWRPRPDDTHMKQSTDDLSPTDRPVVRNASPDPSTEISPRSGSPIVAVTRGVGPLGTTPAAPDYLGSLGADGEITLADPEGEDVVSGSTVDEHDVMSANRVQLLRAGREGLRAEAGTRSSGPGIAQQPEWRRADVPEKVELSTWPPFNVRETGGQRDADAATLPPVAQLPLAGFRRAGVAETRLPQQGLSEGTIGPGASADWGGLRDVDGLVKDGGSPERLGGALTHIGPGYYAPANTATAPQRGVLPFVMPQDLAESLLHQSGRQVEVTMQPEELGRVRMLLSSGEGSINLVITGERQDTLDLLRRHIDALVQDFRKLGFESVGFEFRQFGSGNRQGRSTPARSRRPGIVEDRGEPAASRRHPAVSGLDMRI